MKMKFMGAVVLLVLLVLAFGVVGQAVAGSSVEKIIKDAEDGTIDGNWSAAQIQAALAFLRNSSTDDAYGNEAGVLEDYLASLQDPGAIGGQLAFTGGEVFVVLAVGLGLLSGGLLLRRRSRA